MPLPPVFPLEPDGADSIREAITFKTDIMQARSGREQRIAVKVIPGGWEEFSLFALDADAYELQGAFQSAHHEQWVVPLWQWESSLSEDITTSSTEFNLTDNQVPFYDWQRNPRLVLLWENRGHYEVAQIIPEGTAASNPWVLAAAVAETWPAGTRVIPARLGRLRPQESSDFQRTNFFTGRVRFDFEDAFGRAYLGMVNAVEFMPVLEDYLVPQNRTGPRALSHEARFVVLNSGSDVRGRSLWSPVPGQTLQVECVHFTRPDALYMRDTFETLMGRANPFLLPTNNRDFEVVSASETTATVVFRGYTASMFPGSFARRRIRFSLPYPQDRFITAAVDNEDGTETLTLDTALDEVVPAGSFASFLLYCRMDSDELVLEYHGRNTVSCSLPVREIGVEAPAA